MASGKTAVGSALADRLGVRFVDLDRHVEADAGADVATVFARHGEAFFRDLEHQALRRTAEAGSAVVSTGGGTMIAERNRDLIRELGTSVWLDADTASRVAARIADLLARENLCGTW
jgi:shikimate kinase